jgi:hypothetical protein
MRSLRSLIDPGGRSLIYHLDRLRATLDALIARLRSSIAEAISQSAAGVVRDTIQGLLASPASQTRPRYHDDYDPRRSSWDDFDDGYGYRGPRYDDDDGDVYDRPYPRGPQASPGSRTPRMMRWSHAIAAGLRTAAWWLQDRTGAKACLVALGIGGAASVVFLFGGMVTASGISLVLSVLSLTGLQALLNDHDRRVNSLGVP